MLPAVPEASNARATRVLALVWLVLVPAWWLGMFVASMDAEAPRRIAIDLDGYFLPHYVWASKMLARDVLPLWNPYELAGVPMLGVGQAAVLYPPRVLLFGVLPPGLALHAFFVVHYLLLGAGAFMMLRAFGLAWPGAALGALVVTFQPFMLHGHYAPHWISNFAWTPLAIAAFVRLVERPRLAAAAGLVAAVSMQVYAGYPEYAFDTVLALTVLWPFLAWRVARTGDAARVGRGVLWIGAAAVTTALATAVQWVPLLEAARESVRAAGEYQFMFGMAFDRAAFAAGLRGWVDALGLLFYVPPIGWVLLAVGVVAGRPRHRAALLALALLAWAAPTWLRDVPPFALFRGPLCWHSMLHLPLGAFAGGGLDQVLAATRAPGRERTRHGLWLAMGLLVAALVPLISVRALLWTALGLAGLVLARARPAGGVVLVLAAAVGTIWTWVPGSAGAIVHRWAAGQPPYPRVAERLADGAVVREACGRFAAGRILAPRETWLGVPILAGLRSVQGYPESLAPRRTSRLLAAAGLAPNSVFPLDRERVAAAGPLLALLDVRCMVLPADWAPVAERIGYASAGTLPDGRIVRVRDGHAAVLVRTVEAVPDDDAAFARVTAAGFDPARSAIVVGPAGPAEPPPGGPGRVEAVARPTPGRLAIRVDVPAGGYLVVPETWYPGWRATVDGVRVPVERADYAFLGLPLPAGAREVSLRYEPRGFGMAAWATLAGVATLVGAAVVGTGKRRAA